MEQAAAMNYLRNFCVVADAGDAALEHYWEQARQQLGAPMANAGAPTISDIPAEHQPYLQGVSGNPRFADTVGAMPWSFQLVEVEPLLAYQAHVLTRPGTPATATPRPSPKSCRAACRTPWTPCPTRS
jgi:hypothetical protein